ncbi:hypothetical protein QR680_016200 [Steinernema hermaphroditum]|uniref:TIL domain-containing protein n=1 Tax=Steinernema hermaphroditum TaxID=289476 RepID=A0AA39LM64_9BILA|nr:hypothetical protein QR680_016200 [Steinernema hermaphroditum]
MKSLCLLVLLFSTIAFAQDQKCGAHEVADDCPCDPTCESPFFGLCGFGCVKGCACVRPYVRHNGKCILPNECPEIKKNTTATAHKCGPREVYYPDEDPSVCPSSCDEPHSPFCVRMGQEAGCYCKEPFVLHEDKCILPSECPAKKSPDNECGPHQSYYGEDDEYCYSTCDIPYGCLRIYLGAGCFCDKPYVTYGDDCVLPSQCPKKNYGFF